MITPLARAARVALALLALTLGGVPARAQLGGAAPAPPAHVLTATAGPVHVTAGGGTTAEVRLTVAPGWHVNANPPKPDYMIATEVAIAGQGGLGAGAPAYPASVPLKVGFEEQPIAVYGGSVTVRVPLRAAASTVAGAYELKGTVQFQACNDQVCLPPAEATFKLAVMVSGGAGAGAVSETAAAAPATSAAPDSQAAATAVHGASPAGGAPASAAGGGALADALARGGLGWFLALFLGGLALNLTPCVFPMIGITVSVFGARRKEPLPQVLAHAIAYVLGIAVTYSVLGVIAGLTGGLFGAALQNTWVLVALGALLIVLALSMFGLYELQPPPWLLQRLGGADASSLLGIFLNGLAVGIIAAPCVGPFVVAVLALIAQRGSVAFGLETMFVLSLGLGFPYLVLAMFSNLLQSLPRAGEWMVWVKHAFGVGLTAFGLYYVLTGLAPAYVTWVLPGALLIGGVYLGFIDRHGSQKVGFRGFKMAVGMVAVAGGIASIMMLRAEGIRFQPYDETAMRTAIAQGRPVMLEFSASWCLPCHELDRNTFTDPRVKDLSRRYALFKVDLTHYDAPESQALRVRYGVTGVPEVLFFTPDGRELRDARVLGFLPPGPFLERMQAALGE